MLLICLLTFRHYSLPLTLAVLNEAPHVILVNRIVERASYVTLLENQHFNPLY